MNKKMPRTPFSTHLSGSARETEIRLRNIFSGPKKRPPLPFLILMFAIAIFCGNLVSCRQRPPEPSLVMETQYYDSYGNYVELPALALPSGQENEAVDAINEALNHLRGEYAQLDSRTGTDAWENQCLFYPSTTDRYLNLLFFRSQFTTDLNTGHVFSLVYDKREGTLVSTGDALALAGLNEKGLLDQVAEQMEPEMNPEGQGYQIALHNLTLEGFRVKADGQPVFYLTGRMDDVDDAVLDAVSGADQLFIWEDRAVTVYDQYSLNAPLVPAEETDRLDPPLWNQWYFAGEEPVGGFVDRSSPDALNFDTRLTPQSTWRRTPRTHPRTGISAWTPLICLERILWRESSWGSIKSTTAASLRKARARWSGRHGPPLTWWPACTRTAARRSSWSTLTTIGKGWPRGMPSVRQSGG